MADKSLLNDIILDDYFILKEKFTKEAVRTTYGIAVLVMKFWFWWLDDNQTETTSAVQVEKESKIIEKLQNNDYSLVIEDYLGNSVEYKLDSIGINLPKEMINKMELNFISTDKLDVGKAISVSLRRSYSDVYKLKGVIKTGEVKEETHSYKYSINLSFYHGENINSAKALLVYYKNKILKTEI